jgi:hypothetical protein
MSPLLPPLLLLPPVGLLRWPPLLRDFFPDLDNIVSD